MDPSEQQIFTSSGTYIVNDRLECNGYVTSISFCGVLVDEREPLPQLNVYRFTLLHLRLSSSGDRYDVIDQENIDYEMEDAANSIVTTSDPTCQSHDFSGWFVLQGDQLGVIQYAHCKHSQRSNNYCPIQIGLINTGCTDSSSFIADSVDNSMSYYSEDIDSIPKSNISQVAVKLNFEIHYDNNIGKLANAVVNIIIVIT